MKDQKMAENLFRRGKIVAFNRDKDGLRMVLTQLMELLPEEQRTEIGGVDSTVQQ
jgi:hypothetical protein